MSRRRTSLLLVLALAAVPVPGVGAASCAAMHKGIWSTVPLPSGAGAPQIAVAFGRPEAVLAASGRTVQRTTDSGCTWTSVLSLDSAPSGSLVADPESQLLAIGASEPDAKGQTTVYAVAHDSLLTLATVAMPVTLVVSTDSGAHWTFRPVPLTSTGTYPRCGSSGAISVSSGPDPATVVVQCSTATIATVFNSLAGECQSQLWVSHDRAVTWTAVTHASSATAPCDKFVAPRFDRIRNGVAWDMEQPDGFASVVMRSDKYGVEMQPFTATKEWLWSTACYDGTHVGDGQPVGAMSSAGGILYSTGPGKGTPPPPMPIPGRDLGYTRCVAFVPGTPRLLVMYYDANHRARLFVLNVLKKRWSELARPPMNGKDEAWNQKSPAITALASGRSPYVYIRCSTTVLYRVRAR